jgi:ABC-type polar amino acid transport system ATPase subunit
MFFDEDVFALKFSGLSKSLKTLVDAEAANAGALNAIQTAYSKELEAQKQTTERRENLFNVLQKYTEFTHGEIVKAALIIGQNEAKLNLFFTTPEFRSSLSVRCF